MHFCVSSLLVQFCCGFVRVSVGAAVLYVLCRVVCCVASVLFTTNSCNFFCSIV